MSKREFRRERIARERREARDRKYAPAELDVSEKTIQNDLVDTSIQDEAAPERGDEPEADTSIHDEPGQEGGAA